MSFSQVGSSAPQTSLDTDVMNFERRLTTIRDNKDKIQNATVRRTCKRTLGELDSITETLRGKIQTADPGLRDRFQRGYQEFVQLRGPLNAQIASLDEQERAAAAPSSGSAPSGGGPQATQTLMTAEQQEAQRQADELAYMQREANDIVETMQTINELSHDLDAKITDQHATLVHIDATITEAKEEMVQGNEELKKAEEHQKSCNVQ